MTQSAVEWLEKICNERGYHLMSEYFEQAKEMERKEKCMRQLFVGKVSDIIGFNETIELLKQCKEAFKK